MLPAASRARACSVCTPFDAEVVSHVIEYGAVVSSAPRLAPSSRNWTPATPTLSVALAETVTFPETTDPAAGRSRLRSGRGVGCGGGGGGGDRGVGAEVVGLVDGADLVAVGGRGGQAGVVEGGAGGGADLGEVGAAGAGAALDAVLGDADVVGGGGPAEVDLGGARRRGGQPGRRGRRGGVGRRGGGGGGDRGVGAEVVGLVDGADLVAVGGRGGQAGVVERGAGGGADLGEVGAAGARAALDAVAR